MKLISVKNSITFLIASTLLLALAYTLETNQVAQDKSLLAKEREAIKELRLEQQTSLEKLSLIHLGKDMTEVQAELELEQVKGFTLLHPKQNQLSLHQESYEL